jgi:hypothetical protein
MNYYNYILIGIIFAVFIFLIYWYNNTQDNFNSNLSPNYQTVDYNTQIQKCNELTFNPDKCINNIVMPKTINVCNTDYVPNINYNKEYNKEYNQEYNKEYKKKYKKKINLELLQNSNNKNTDLLNNDKYQDIPEKKINNKIITEIKSLNSIENDLFTN